MEHYIEYLDAAILRLKEEKRSLLAAERKDEADLTKIRANVYGICRTVVKVLDAEAFRNKMDGLHREWTAALELASAHGDGKRAAIEEIKLETLADAAAHFVG